jgi:hypothetical protein
MTILRATAGVAFAVLLVLLGCDAFGLSQIDDRRAAERHELLHPGESGSIVVHNPKPVTTGPGSMGMIGE